MTVVTAQTAMNTAVADCNAAGLDPLVALQKAIDQNQNNTQGWQSLSTHQKGEQG
jgi:hypothetical protein